MTDDLIERLRTADDDTIYDVMREAVYHFHSVAEGKTSVALSCFFIICEAQSAKDPRLLLGVAATFVPDECLWDVAFDEDGVAGPRSYTAGVGYGYHNPQYIYGHNAVAAATAVTLACLETEKRG